MPITITFPPVQSTVGPGLNINLGSDFIGPFPADAQWHLAINLQPDFVDPVLEYTQPCTGNNTSLTLLVPSTWTETRQFWMPVDQRVVFIEARITTDTGVIDSGTLQAPWDTTTGLGWQIQATTGQGTGGFTAQDRATLQTTLNNTTTSFLDTTIPADMSQVPVGKLPGQPPLIWGVRVGPFTLNGNGTLDLVASGILGVWLGMRWFYAATPPGWGFTPGAIDEFARRPAQLVPIGRLQSGEEIGQPILDTNSSGGYQTLEFGFFSGKISYSVAPGFTVSLFMYKLVGT